METCTRKFGNRLRRASMNFITRRREFARKGNRGLPDSATRELRAHAFMWGDGEYCMDAL